MPDINTAYNNFSNYNIPPPVTTPTSATAGPRLEAARPLENVQTGSLSGPSAAGELPYQAAGVNGTDWDALTNDLATSANLMVSLSAIMTLLIEVMSQMRQDQREVALADAQNALQSGLNASQAMKQAAGFALASGLASSGVSMVSGAVSVKQSGNQLRQLDQAKQDLTAANSTKGPNRQTEIENADKQFGSVSTSVNAQANQTRAITEMNSGVSGMLGSVLNFFAESARAEAKSEEAQAQYQQSIQQADQAFFQQMGDSIRALMQSWQSADRSTHEASQAIYNV
jgi:hypothetical protein